MGGHERCLFLPKEGQAGEEFIRILRVRAHILGDPLLKVFLEPRMGLPDSFRKYRYWLGRSKSRIIHYTISRVINTFSVLVIVEEPSTPLP